MFKFSGELTTYRYSFFLDLQKYFLLTNDKTNYGFKYFINKIKNKNNQFIDIDSKHKYKFSFHPKKIDDWSYSSPVRYISALKKGEMPIVFDNFVDSISDKLTISLNKISKKKVEDLFYIKSKSIYKLKKGIKRYNRFFGKNKKIILKQTLKLLKNLD